MAHQEWNKEHSLTASADRDLNNKWKPEQRVPSLTNEETELAMTELNNTAFVDKFPRVDRTYADPPVPLQMYGLISFTPAKDATPNENGVYGFAKLRGNYGTTTEANQRAEYLIRNIDSYHQIYHTYVGRPFPITVNSKYSAETEEIDIRKETTKAVSEDIKAKKLSDKKTIQDIKEREKELIADTKRDEPDPYDTYITLRVKKAQLSWAYLEHQKKLQEVKLIIRKTIKEIDEMNEEYPDYQDTYYEKYLEARRESGIKDEGIEAMNNFMKYMVEDSELVGLYDD